MEDKWRIPFTALALIGIGFGSYFHWAFGVASYLWLGFLIAIICLPYTYRRSFFKMTIVWLPGLWNEKIRDWMSE